VARYTHSAANAAKKCERSSCIKHRKPRSGRGVRGGTTWCESANFLPEKSNPVKRANIARLGAEIVERGSADLAAAFEAATEYAQAQGAFF